MYPGDDITIAALVHQAASLVEQRLRELLLLGIAGPRRTGDAPHGTQEQRGEEEARSGA